MHREPTAISLVAMAMPNMPVRSQRPMSENVVNSMPIIASRPDGRRVHRHAARAPHQVELEIDELGGAVVVRLRADADETVAQPTLQRAEALPLARGSPWQSAQARPAAPVFFSQSVPPSSTQSMPGLAVSSSCIARVSRLMNS